MFEALETLYAMRIIAELKNDRPLINQLNSDIKSLESEIRQYKGW